MARHSALRRLLLAMLVIVVVLVVAYFAFRSFVCNLPLVGRFLCRGGAGSACSLHTDCDGWVAGKPGTLACCADPAGKSKTGKVCTPQLADWAGVGYCPEDCRDAPAPLGQPGSCLSGNHWKRRAGEPCDTHVACDGWTAAKAGTLACCADPTGKSYTGKACTAQLADWAGVGYCPEACYDAPAPLGRPGSCLSGNHWPRQYQEPCDTHAACQGWVAGRPGTLACCADTTGWSYTGRSCTPLKRDWAGVGYCPEACQGCPSCVPGTCA